MSDDLICRIEAIEASLIAHRHHLRALDMRAALRTDDQNRWAAFTTPELNDLASCFNDSQDWEVRPIAQAFMNEIDAELARRKDADGR